VSGDRPDGRDKSFGSADFFFFFFVFKQAQASGRRKRE